MHSFALSLGERALVLKEFSIDENATTGAQVRIVARKEGLIAWLLTLMGIDVTTIFEVYSNRIEFSRGSLSGKLCNVIPLSALSVGTTGYTKPIIFLVLAAIAFIAGIVLAAKAGFLAFLLGLVIAIAFFISYFLKKSLLISAISHSSFIAGFAFKRSIIEGVKVDYEQALQVISIINRNIIQQSAK